MGIFDKQKTDGSWVFAPKMGGEPVVVVVTGGIERVKTDNDNEMNYKKRGQNFGYYDILEVDGDKKLIINTWKLYFALKECNPDIDDEIKIEHPENGVYKVTKN